MTKRGHEPPPLKGQGWLRDPALLEVLGALNLNGLTRVAGGAVRNALLGLAVGEVDLATTLTPQEVMRAAEDAGLKAHPTGIEHGTVTVVARGRPFEVTTLRQDVETYGRRARVAFTSDWEADAARRDFTMNALYCNAEGVVFDPLGGYGDLKRKIVRFVGKPQERIKEDYLRILRFFRFNAQYGRGAPEREGLRHCARLRRHLKALSAERIRQELWKLLQAPGAVRMLEVMKEQRVLEVLLGRAGDLSAVKRMARIDAALKLAADPLLRLEALGNQAERHRERLKLTNAEMARLKALRAAPFPSPDLSAGERKAVLYALGRQAFSDAVRLAWARSRVSAQDRRWCDLLMFERRTELPQFPVTGHDLKQRGIAAGPRMGAILRALEDWWIAAGFPPDRETVLRRLDVMAPLPNEPGCDDKGSPG